MFIPKKLVTNELDRVSYEADWAAVTYRGRKIVVIIVNTKIALP
jgi:hypothetical protein